MTESFTELFEESIKDTEMRSGEVVLGKVIHVDSETVIVSAGLKSEQRFRFGSSKTCAERTT